MLIWVTMKSYLDHMVGAKNQWERVQEKMGKKKGKRPSEDFFSKVEQRKRAVGKNRFRFKRRF